MIQADFVKRFIDTLGDVKDYEHTGVVNDLGAPEGHCVCGHIIQYEYEIKNKITGKIAFVGSECINNFKDYNLELYNSLIATIERRKKEKKEDKEKPMLEEIEVLKSEIELQKKIVIKSFNKLSNNGKIFVDHDLWSANNYCENNITPKVVRISAILNFYKKEYVYLKGIIEQFNLPTDISFNIANKEVIVEEYKKLVEDNKEVLSNKTIKINSVITLNMYKCCFIDSFEILDYDDMIERLTLVKKILSSIDDYGIWKVIGKSYEVKDSIKSQGFMWDSYGSTWYKLGFSDETFTAIDKIKYEFN